MRYRAPPAEALLTVELDAFTAILHRPSGTTHLLASPAPEILAALAEVPLGVDTLLARLAARFDLADANPVALTARLDELIEAGLIEAV